jgi:nicotinamide-nucleotide amidase
MRSPVAEIISIGSELMRGSVVNTNASWLSGELSRLGVSVRFRTTVGDVLPDIRLALEQASRRADLVLCTGGLGPTQDDLTREALAQFADRSLCFDEASWERIRRRLEKANRPISELQRVQAYLPKGAEALPNDYGTAPGIWMPLDGDDRRVIVALPGVPDEMKLMFQEQLVPRLKAYFGIQQVFVERRLHVFGATETQVEERILDWTRRGQDPEVGLSVHEGTVTLRIVTAGKDPQEARRRMEPVVRQLYERLGELIYGEDDEELADVVGRELARLRLSLAVAEGCTGGLVQALLVRVAGASSWFRGGIVAYANDIKTEWLAVPMDLLSEHGAASRSVAEAAATAVRLRFAADLGLAVVGFCGPSLPANGAAPTAWIAVASEQRTSSEQYCTLANRSSSQLRMAKATLNHLRLRLRRAAVGPV